MMNQPALSLITSASAVGNEPRPCSDDAIREALRRVLTSKQFAKARRCTALLVYLVERVLVCDDADASPPEHEIGVAVFGRDPAAYSPADDPIVRVQAGRLRLRLTAYYADEGVLDALRISVPPGRYHARILPADDQGAGGPVPAGAPLLLFSPLICLCAGAAANHFTAGLNDELGFRLYRELRSLSLPGGDSPAPADSQSRARYLLEGTVRQDAALLRVSLILRHGAGGAVLWYAQFDRASGIDGAIDAAIGDQEQMAARCVAALQQHLPRGTALRGR
jgi:TolB-like protein